MNTNDKASVYGAALTRFFAATGLSAAELAELAGLEPIVLLDAASGAQLPRFADRGRIADEIRLIRQERGLA
jgi:hypothetical protein